MHKGIKFYLKNEKLELDDVYLIKSSSHNIEHGKETVDVEIKLFQ